MLNRWKSINGFENYEISENGEIRNKNSHNILYQGDNGHGYRQVFIYKDGKKYMRYVHRLVAESFLGPIPRGFEINHIDKNRGNNNIKNLEYLNHIDNINYSVSKKVERINIKTGEIDSFNSMVEASNISGINVKTIRKYIKNGCAYKGYLWKLKI